MTRLTIATSGRMRCSYHMWRSGNGWHHTYSYSGGWYGEHAITCDQPSHDDRCGPTGRALSHWQGYIAASQEAATG